MIIVDCQQGSPEWLISRLGIPTASEFDKILTPTGKLSTSADGYMYRLLGEWISGKPAEQYISKWMERGTEVEAQARDFYSFKTDADVQQVGFIYKDESKLAGCSPDGIVSTSIGLEIKSPLASTHVRYLLKGEVPTEYQAQIQGSLWITGFEFWDFLSYHPDMPSVIIRVGRDEKYIQSLEIAVSNFISVMMDKRSELLKRGLVPAIPIVEASHVAA